MPVNIESPTRADIVALLHEHLQDMAAHSPPDSVHALDLSALKAANIAFLTARTETGELQGCAALKTLSAQQGELKSMRTATQHLRRGVAANLLETIIALARRRGMHSISLETGTPEAFAPARELYSRFGFITCSPFGDYQEDPYSVCMTLSLTGTSCSS